MCGPSQAWGSLSGPDHRLLLPSGGGPLHDGEFLSHTICLLVGSHNYFLVGDARCFKMG